MWSGDPDIRVHSQRWKVTTLNRRLVKYHKQDLTTVVLYGSIRLCIEKVLKDEIKQKKTALDLARGRLTTTQYNLKQFRKMLHEDSSDG